MMMIVLISVLLVVKMVEGNGGDVDSDNDVDIGG